MQPTKSITFPATLAIKYPDGTWAGSPATVRTANPNLAGTYRDEAEAQATADMLGEGAAVVVIKPARTITG